MLFVISVSGIHSVAGISRPITPIVNAGGPYDGTEGTAINFDSSATYDPEERITAWLWDFGDGQSSTEQNPTHVYLEDGTYSVKLSVTYKALILIDITDEDSTTAKVADTDPEAKFSTSRTSGFEPLTITFNDQTTTHDGIYAWLWDFGDGQTSEEQNPTHTYTEGVYTVSLTVTEEDGDTDTKTEKDIITVEPPPNVPPEADFIYQSSPKTTTSEIIVFTDRSSDIDGTIISWFWDFGDGTTSTQKNPTHQYSKIGKFTITLTVEDDDAATSRATKQITVHDVNPPITVHDYDGLWHTTDFSINLLATDNHSGVAETYYKINNGATQRLSVNGQPKITMESPNNTIEYWSTDNDGNEEEHHIIFNIKLDKTAPTADAGPDITTDENTVVTLGGNSKDNIQIANYTWNLFDNGLKTLTGENPQYTFYTPGIYNITLTVTDPALNSANDALTITVLDVTKPIANAGDDIIIYEGGTATFVASKSTDNVKINSYVWTFTDVFPQSLNGATPTYAFTTVGVYEITLTVTDEQGNSATDSVMVTVIDASVPIADAGDDQTIVEDTLVKFDGSASYDNVGIISYVWTFTDGKIQSLEGAKVEYYFETPGEYLITLKVTDAENNSSTDSITVIVQAKAAFIIEVQNKENAVENNPIIFNAINSSDTDGIVNYCWNFGDNTIKNTSDPSVAHVYTEPGNYTVELLVTDITGKVNHFDFVIVVHQDSDANQLADYLEEDKKNGASETLESPNAIDSTSTSDKNNLQQNKSTAPKVHTFYGRSLADLLTIFFCVFVVSCILFYIRQLKLADEQGKK